MPHRFLLMALALLTALAIVGCGKKLKPTRTGFLSDYSQLEKVNKRKYHYISDQVLDYHAWIVDPIEIQAQRDPPVLKPEQRAEVAVYFHDKIVEMLESRDIDVAHSAGVGVARIRIAITNVKKSTFWLNIHPGSKLMGAGLGGASMETEIIDSVTGEQLAAVIQAGRGNQFELDTFNGIDDIKDVINRWARNAGERIDELREVRASEAAP